ncbi:MAG: helix-hairpin-helix domain-containing protein [Gammaproteobacteria bacterium]
MNTLHRAFLVSLLLAVSFGLNAEPVDINTADAETLSAELDGVGEKRAQEIVRYRKEYGPFESVDELTNVKGVGQKVLDDNRDNLVVGSDKDD